MNDRSYQVKNSVVKIFASDLNGKAVSSGWIFSYDGLVLTTAHGLLSVPTGSEVVVVFPNEFSTTAIVEERDQTADFAILRLQEVHQVSFSPLLPTRSQTNGREFFAFGHRPAVDAKLVTSLTGKIRPSPLGREHLLHLEINQPEDLRGLSGAAICIEENNSPRVVGMCVHQPENQASRNNVFALPLSEIRLRSKLFERAEIAALSGQRLLACLDKFDGKISIRESNNRYNRIVLLLAEEYFGGDESGATIAAQKVMGQRLEIADLIESRLKSISGSKKTFPLTLDLRMRKARSGEFVVEDLLDELSSLDDAEDLRIIINCSPKNSIIFSKTETRRKISHLVEARLASSVGSRDWSFETIAELAVALPDETQIQLRTAIENLIEDILTDIYIFNSKAIPRQLFRSGDAKRSFSRLKVRFAASNQGLVYGHPVKADSEGLGYIPFGALCRSSLTDKLDRRRLVAYWASFLDSVVVPSLVAPDGDSICGQTLKEITSALLMAKNLGGQISAKKLRTSFLCAKVQDGEIVAVCQVIRDPGVETRDKLRTMLGIAGKLGANSVGVVRVAFLPDLSEFLHCVKASFFKFKTDSTFENCRFVCRPVRKKKRTSEDWSRHE